MFYYELFLYTAIPARVRTYFHTKVGLESGDKDPPNAVKKPVWSKLSTTLNNKNKQRETGLIRR